MNSWIDITIHQIIITIFHHLQGNNGVVNPKTLQETDEQKFQSHIHIQINKSSSPPLQQQDQKHQSNTTVSDGDFEFVSCKVYINY